MLQKLQQPLVVDVVKEAADVRIQYPIHFLRLDAHAQGIQGAVTASSGTIAVTETLKVLFVDAFENRPYGPLDDFVLQCRDP